MHPAEDLRNSPQGLLLYVHPDDHYSHRVRFALAEKAIDYQLIVVDPQAKPEDLAQLNPYNSLPTLVDRHVCLYETGLILDYLDERYRQTRLLSDNPIDRATERQYAWRIAQDWLKRADILLTHPDSLDAQQAKIARQELRDSLINLAPLFGYRTWFMRDQFGLCDCILAPILWRLPQLQIDLPPALCAPLLAYCQRLFQRPAFLASLTARERSLRA